MSPVPLTLPSLPHPCAAGGGWLMGGHGSNSCFSCTCGVAVCGSSRVPVERVTLSQVHCETSGVLLGLLTAPARDGARGGAECWLQGWAWLVLTALRGGLVLQQLLQMSLRCSGVLACLPAQVLELLPKAESAVEGSPVGKRRTPVVGGCCFALSHGPGPCWAGDSLMNQPEVGVSLTAPRECEEEGAGTSTHPLPHRGPLSLQPAAASPSCLFGGRKS